jgi:hypothetical protein
MKSVQWRTNPARFLAMTGYTIENFDALLPTFAQVHDHYFDHYLLNGKPRSGQRSFVLYQNAALPTHAERLAFVLSYLKLNPIQEDHADRFSLTQKQVNEFFHGLKPLLDKALEQLKAMPAQTQQALQEHLQADTELMHDATERPIPRPVDQEDHEKYYSGKKKGHTVKNAVLINTLSIVVFWGLTVAGRVHDKKLADSQYALEGISALWQDTGYQGYAPANVHVYQPIKKPRGRELSEAQKAYNRSVSQIRVQVEHVIGSMKRYRIVKDECRLRKGDFVSGVLVSCGGLHNFRVARKPVNYPERPKPKLA